MSGETKSYEPRANAHQCARRSFFAMPTPIEWAAIAGMVVVLVALLLPNVKPAQSGARRDTCRNLMKRLGLALHNYHDAHGCFPPAYYADTKGQPAHSWRTILLPQLELESVHAAYDFAPPWNDATNSELNRLTNRNESPSSRLGWLECPSDEPDGTGHFTTNYVAVVGEGTAWPGARALKSDEITDDPATTVLLVETADSDIAVFEPRDLAFDDLPMQLNPPEGRGISSGHKGGAHVLMADGSVIFLPNDIPREVLRAMLTVSGGEEIDLEDFVNP